MANLPSGIQDKLLELKRLYAQKLPDKIDAIEKITHNLLNRKWDSTLLKELHRIAHTLAGSGGSFGLGDVGQKAKVLEDLTQTLIKNSEKPTQEVELNLKRSVKDLKQVSIDAVNDTSSPAKDPPKEPIADVQKKHVVLMTDDDQIVEDLKHQLDAFGYRIQWLKSPQQIASGDGKPLPAAIILDIHFLSDALGSSLKSPSLAKSIVGIPLLFISNEDNFELRLKATRAGGSAFITRPLDILSLIDALENLAPIQPADPFRVLVIDDKPEVALKNAATLAEAGIQTSIVTDPSQVMKPIVEMKPDVLLVDLHMDACSGLELTQVIRQQGAYAEIPIVFSSAAANLSKKLHTLNLGHDAFLSGPVDPVALVSTVIDRARRARAVKALITRDGLTGLLNHSSIKAELILEVARARRNGTSFCYAVIDIDRFKEINTTYGHLVGDRVAKAVARLMQQRFRRTDVLGRYGGDEFVVILSGVGLAVAKRIFEEFQGGLSKISSQVRDDMPPITLSCGLSCYPQLNNAEALRQAADRALYQAKQAGGARVVVGL